MKKFYVMAALVVVLLAAGNVHAQRMIYASYDPEIFMEGNVSQKLHGVTFGFLKDFEFSRQLHVAVGGQYRMNVRYYTLNGVSVNDQHMAIDVPVMINYPIRIDRDLYFIPFGGPMASLALAGYTKAGKSGATIQWYDENSNRKRFNIYAVLGGDFNFDLIHIFGGIRLGMLDLSTSDLSTIKTKGFFVGLGLNF